MRDPYMFGECLDGWWKVALFPSWTCWSCVVCVYDELMIRSMITAIYILLLLNTRSLSSFSPSRVVVVVLVVVVFDGF